MDDPGKRQYESTPVAPSSKDFAVMVFVESNARGGCVLTARPLASRVAKTSLHSGISASFSAMVFVACLSLNREGALILDLIARFGLCPLLLSCVYRGGLSMPTPDVRGDKEEQTDMILLSGQKVRVDSVDFIMAAGVVLKESEQH
jgi:hypothetical protein